MKTKMKEEKKEEQQIRKEQPGRRIKGQRIRDRLAVPVHETFRVAALLALVGGFLDAYTYLMRGGVFANAQTGNMVLLGLKIAEGNIEKAVYYLIPIAAFAMGVFVTEVIKKYGAMREMGRLEHWIIAIEMILILIVGFVPQSVPDAAVNITISFVCSLQVNSFRTMKSLPYATTMCTGNLRSGTEKLFRFLINKEEKTGIQAAHYFGIIGIFIVGAILGALLCGIFGVHSVWFCCLLLLIVFLTIRKA